MLQLFYEGGALFMSILSIVFLAMIITAVVNGVPIASGKVLNVEQTRYRLSYIKSLGLLAVVIGLLGQMIGLFMAFEAIAEMGEVSQAMLAGGLRVSSITTIYGLIIFIIAYLIWFVLDLMLNKAKQ